MRQRIRSSVCVPVALFVLSSTALCQTGGARFDRKIPKVGEPLPNITILDADGNDFYLRGLKDNYTVLVFGCLT
ncbi:MAG: peroxiredoxin family protein [Fuerstiella sp.]|nr:peroxiredoxin family protein [Fuerstiella sp.]